MFWHLKNRIKEETGNDVDLIPSIVNQCSNQAKPNKEKPSHQESGTNLASFTIDSSRVDGRTLDLTLADGKVLTSKEFKRLESKEDEWRRKLERKEEEMSLKLKKFEDIWRKQLDDKEREMKEELDKKEMCRKHLEKERDELKLRNVKLEEDSKRASEYQKKICQYQEDIDQLQGFQTQEVAKIKHLLLVKEQELSEKDQLLRDHAAQLKSLKQEISRLRDYEHQYENVQDRAETMRHKFDLERSLLSSKLAEKEEDVRHLRDKVALLEERANAGPIAKMTVDERVQKLLGERALFERRLEEAHLHLSQIKSSWSGKIESLETQVERLCRQASEESAEKRQAESERDRLKAEVAELRAELEATRSKCDSATAKLDKLTLEKTALEEAIYSMKIKTEREVNCLEKDLKTAHESSSLLEMKLREKDAEAETQRKMIASLESKLTKEAEEKASVEAEVARLLEELDAEKKASGVLDSALDRERREKDDMMMRNAEISQEVELAKQDRREQELEASELQSRLSDLEMRLREKERELKRSAADRSDLAAKLQELEKFERDQESSRHSVEKDLKAKVVRLENELFDKNKNLKVMQQRLTDMKKTLQRELKVPATSIDPGGPDPDVTGLGGFLSARQSSNSPRGEDTFDEPCEDVNFRYLKHVVMKFLTSRECEAQHLTRAVATLLKFTPDEEKLLKETLEWKMSWFGTRPNLGNGQTAKTIPPR